MSAFVFHILFWLAVEAELSQYQHYQEEGIEDL